MIDIKIIAKNEKELETPDIRIELDREKCAMLIIKKGKRETTEEIELLNQK